VASARQTKLRHVRSIRELAIALSLDRDFLTKVLRRDDCPKKKRNGEFDVAAWHAFVEREGLGRAHRSQLKQQLECEVLAEKKRRLQLENELREGELVERKEVIEIVVRAVTLFRQMLETKFLVELPPIYTADAPANQEANEHALVEALNEFGRELWPACHNQFARPGEQLKIFDATVARLREVFTAAAPEGARMMKLPKPMGRPVGT